MSQPRRDFSPIGESKVRTTVRVAISGKRKHVSAEVALADIAKKCRGVDLTSGEHVITVLEDGSIMLDGATIWQPKAAMIAKRAG